MDQRLPASLFETGKVPVFGGKAATQDQSEAARGDVAFLFEGRLLRAMEHMDWALFFAEVLGTPRPTPALLWKPGMWASTLTAAPSTTPCQRAAIWAPSP